MKSVGYSIRSTGAHLNLGPARKCGPSAPSAVPTGLGIRNAMLTQRQSAGLISFAIRGCLGVLALHGGKLMPRRDYSL